MSDDPAAQAAPPIPAVPANGDCWNRIGVRGDSSCPELEQWIHCRNCPVYTAAGRRLLERPAPAAYLEEWTRQLAEEKSHQKQGELSVLIFRLHGEWLALRSTCVVEVTETRACRRLPFRRNSVLRGIVNIRGELQLCFSLHQLLETQAPAEKQGQAKDVPRLVVAAWDQHRWVFGVDEVHGVWRTTAAEIRKAPVTVAKQRDRLTQGVLDWNKNLVACLDETRLFEELKRSLL